MTESHENVKMYECGYCGKSFRKGSLWRHIRQKHEDKKSQDKLMCDKCDFETNSKPSLYSHRLRCQKPQQYECQFCKKK